VLSREVGDKSWVDGGFAISRWDDRDGIRNSRGKFNIISACPIHDFRRDMWHGLELDAY